jgi:hypothetical protein
LVSTETKICIFFREKNPNKIFFIFQRQRGLHGIKKGDEIFMVTFSLKSFKMQVLLKPCRQRGIQQSFESPDVSNHQESPEFFVRCKVQKKKPKKTVRNLFSPHNYFQAGALLDFKAGD